MKKWLIAIGGMCCLVLTVLIVYWQTVEMTLMTWYFEKYCSECIGYQLRYERANYSQAGIQFERPAFLSKDLSLSVLQAEQAVLNYTYSPLDRVIKIDLVVIKPEISPLKESGLYSLQPSKVFNKPKHSLFSIEGSIRSQEGILHTPSQLAIPFEARMFLQKKKQEISITLNHVEDPKKSLELTFKHDQNVLDTEISFHQFKLDQGLSLASSFSFPIRSWMASKGVLNGSFSFSSDSDNFFKMNSDLLLTDAEVFYPKGGLSITIPRLQITIPQGVQEGEMRVENAIASYADALGKKEIKNLQGKFLISDSRAIHYQFFADCLNDEEVAKILVEGNICHLSQPEGSFKLEIKPPERKAIQLAIKGKWKTEEDYGVELEFDQMGPSEWKMLSPLTSYFFPLTSSFTILEGRYSGRVEFQTADLNPILLVHAFSAEHFSAAIGSLHQWRLNAERIESQGVVNLKADSFLKSLSGSVKLSSGSIFFNASDALIPVAIENLHASLSLDHGIFNDESVASFTLQRCLGKVDFSGFLGKEPLKVILEGNIAECASLFPKRFREGISRYFKEDNAIFSAVVNKQDDGFHTSGAIQIENKANDLLDEVLCEFTISGINFSNVAVDFALRKGWFRAENLLLKRYLEPFFANDASLTFKGSISAYGDFDQHNADICFQTHGFEMENEAFKISHAQLKLSDAEQAILFPGKYHFDFIKGEFLGNIPIEKGTYLEKKSGILFHNIQANIKHEPGILKAADVEAFVEGIYGAGSGVFNYKDASQGIFDLEIHNHTLSGKFSDVKRVLSHFGHFFFSGISLQGNVGYRKDGGHFHFAWNPSECTVGAIINGTLNEGLMSNPQRDVSMHDLCLNFFYNHQDSQLELTEIQGSLLVGKPEYLEEFSLAGDHVRFHDFWNDEAEFDVWIGDRQRDMIRVVGKTKRSRELTSLIEFSFDRKLSHFGPVHPSLFKLVLKNWAQVELFQLQMAFSLENFLFDLQRFSKAGLLGLSKGFDQTLQDLTTAKGNVNVDLKYEGANDVLSFYSSGKRLSFPNNTIDTLVLSGSRQNDTWNIEQLQIDQLSLSADLVKESDYYAIHFFGFRYGQSLLMGMEGRFFPDDNRLSATLNLVEMDLEHLGEFSDLTSFVEQHHPKGELRANGNMDIKLFSGTRGWQGEAAVKASLRHFEIDGLSFEDAEQVSCRFHSQQGVTIEGLKSALKQNDKKRNPITLLLHKGGIDFLRKKLWVQKMDFVVPSKRLEWLKESFEKQFPRVLSNETIEILSQSKRDQDLQGSMSLEANSDAYVMQLSLADGVYEWKNYLFDLKNIDLKAEPSGLTFKGAYHLPSQWLVFNAFVPALKENPGRCAFSLPAISDEQCLVVYWDHAFDEIEIKKIEGEIQGLALKLMSSSKNETVKNWTMEGIVEIQPVQLSQWLPGEKIVAILKKWRMDRRLVLDGKWEIQKEFWDQISFNGKLEGKNFSFTDYELDHLSADVEAIPGSVVLKNLEVKDASGILQGKELSFFQDENSRWVFHSPLLSVKEFYPSLLRNVNQMPIDAGKPFVLKQFEISDFKGNIQDESSFSGQGYMQFANPPKKNVSNSVFSLPSDILKRIGLEMPVLTPVSGVIEFEMHDSKVFFTRFKDIYSDNKLVKFYLPKNSSSYLDFQGNLNLKIGLQPYHVIFKFAELLTINIQGTLEKPVFRLKDEK